MAGEYIPGQPGINPITNDSRTATRGPNGLRDDWVERERLKREVAADLGQLALDIAGIIDPTPISDGTSALISLARRRWRDALISAVSIIPYIGDVSKIGKLGRYSNSIRQAILLARMDLEWAVHLRRLLIKLKKPLDELLEVGADKLPERPRRYLQQMIYEIDRFLGPQRALRKPAAKSPGMRQGGGGPGTTGPGPKKPKKTGDSKEANDALRSGEKTKTIDDAGSGAKNKTTVLQAPESQFGKLRLSYEYYKKLGWPKGRIKSHLDGIDFTKEVKTVKLSEGKLTSQFQAPGGKKGTYFAEPNAKATELGISPVAEVNGVLVEKNKTIYRTNADVTVLESTAKSGIIDTWSVPSQPFKTTGGGIQYFTSDNAVFIPK